MSKLILRNRAAADIHKAFFSYVRQTTDWFGIPELVACIEEHYGKKVFFSGIQSRLLALIDAGVLQKSVTQIRNKRITSYLFDQSKLDILDRIYLEKLARCEYVPTTKVRTADWQALDSITANWCVGHSPIHVSQSTQLS